MNEQTITATCSERIFFIIALVLVFPSFFISGFIGIFFEFALALVSYFYLQVGTPKQHPRALLYFIGILLVGLALQSVGINSLADAIQNSSMGR